MNQDAISAALMLDTCSLFWQVQLEPDEMREFARRCTYYNGLTEDKLLYLLDSIDGLVPRIQFGPDNPNNGKPCYQYWIGNQHSRVLYLEIRKSLLPHPLDFAWVDNQLWTLAQEAGADEYKVVQNDDATFLYRIWWD
jgi:hypothetical protein